MENTELQKACRIIQKEYKENGVFRDAFVASIVSALQDSPPFLDDIDIAERIAERIISP